jgi:hypothetical protein
MITMFLATLALWVAPQTDLEFVPTPTPGAPAQYRIQGNGDKAYQGPGIPCVGNGGEC